MDRRSQQSVLESVSRTLCNQSQAMKVVAEQYSGSGFSQEQLVASVELMVGSIRRGGKIVFCGIGKSYKIGSKLVATLNSLSIQSMMLHPSEALHGDLGILRDEDTVVFITASGNTQELLQLLPHISRAIPVILLTCSRSSKLLLHPQVKSLVYAELPAYLKEEVVHGMPAPTVSATILLALADATILALAEHLEVDLAKRRRLFSMKHPGGSIGADLSHLNDNLNRAMVLESPPNGRTFSSQVSSISLLSLGQRSSNSYSMSSEDDNSPISKDLETLYINDNGGFASNTAKIKTVTPAQLESSNYTNELELLKWITIYDYILLQRDDGSKSVVKCDDIKRLYKTETEAHTSQSSNTYVNFHQKLKSYFSEESITNGGV